MCQVPRLPGAHERQILLHALGGGGQGGMNGYDKLVKGVTSPMYASLSVVVTRSAVRTCRVQPTRDRQQARPGDVFDGRVSAKVILPAYNS